MIYTADSVCFFFVYLKKKKIIFNLNFLNNKNKKVKKYFFL